MTPPLTSSPLSSNTTSNLSPSTVITTDENNFPLHQPWPTTQKGGSSMNAANSAAGPLSTANTQLQHPLNMATATTTTASEGWKVTTSGAAAPLPPKPSPKLQPPSSITGMKQLQLHTVTREPVAAPNAVIDSRHGLPPHRTSSERSERASLPESARQRRDSPSVHSQMSGPGWQWEQHNDPDDQEQALFEQRLCQDIYGVAVRKINQHGKSNLRYVKCCFVDVSELEVDSNGFSSSRSVSSHSRRFSRFTRDRSLERDRGESASREQQEAHRTLMKGKKVKVLTWGKKKDVKIPLERFVCVRKGKMTERTRRNIYPATRILSLITDDPNQTSLDIEAPTRLDRDKFARAFSRFLGIPLEGDDVRSIRSDMTPQSVTDRKGVSQTNPTNNSVPDMSGTQTTNSYATNNSRKRIPLPIVTTTSEPRKPRLPKQQPVEVSLSRMSQEAAAKEGSSKTLDIPDPQIASLPSTASQIDSREIIEGIPTPSSRTPSKDRTSERSIPGTPRVELNQPEDEASAMSSMTGAGYDQEIVEELHMALGELRAELEDSRAEAARAVKVAEQAIQSAENSSSKDWNSTVTHKAAEAAAFAQKRSAEAMAKLRFAEERLEGERKSAKIWRKQAEAAEEEAGHWQTRAAAAEVQRAVMAEALESERKKAGSLLTSASGVDALESTMERNRVLELELEVMRRSLTSKGEEVAALQECLEEVETPPEAYKALKKTWGRKSADRDSAARALLSVNTMSSTSAFEVRESSPGQAADVKKQFEALQNTTSDELQSFPDSAKVLAKQASQVVLASQTEIERLRSKLAMESATRRKLLHEVQDLRGTIRVYCRPMAVSKGVSTISTPSQEVLLLHRERAGFREGPANNTPLSFAVDGILDPGMNQQEVYDEMEDVCLGALDGYNICVMSFGQSSSGKTYTILGDIRYDEGNEPTVSIEDYGIHLRAAKQFFSVLNHRSERYEDVVTLNIVEVHDERLCDLLVGTETGEAKGLVQGARNKSNRKRIDSQEGSFASQPTKLEIKTNHNGETVVHGLISVEVSSFDDVVRVWKECLGKRASRLSEQGVDLAEHESNSHVIGTLKVFSTNTSTGVATQGKIQFVDLAASNVVPKRSTGDKKKVSTPEAMMAGVGNNQEWKFANKSMATLTEVVNARSQFQRSIPYRNSTITHLLSDSLEADTKIVVVACVSSDLKDLQETACTLRFAQKLRKIVVGKATKHTLTHA